MEIPTFATKDELHEFLIENKELLIASKKAQIKRADAMSASVQIIPVLNTVSKAVAADDPDEIKVLAIINTTNVIDSHKDVHMPGIWDKSLSENRNILHLQEHELKFEKIISDGEDLKASVKTYTFKDLGYDLPGTTQALLFESTVKRSRNAYMFDQYKSGRVTNHSVGMQYVKIALAVNNKDYGSEFEVWEKYIDQIANKSAAEETGYFWVVREAKLIEGSAVPIGSNSFTPTLSTEIKEEPEVSTLNHNEPSSIDTQLAKEIIHNYFKSLKK